MTERCKSNPCCGDYFNCKRPPQFLPREGYEAYQRRIGNAPRRPTMAEKMPERIWVYADEGAFDAGEWDTDPAGTPFIRADLVDDLVKACRMASGTGVHIGRGEYSISQEAMQAIDAALNRLKEK